MIPTPEVQQRPRAGIGKLAVAAFLSVAALIAVALCLPYQGFANEVFVDIPHGTGTRGIARALARAGVLRSALQFELVRAVRPGAKLQAGEYRFSRSASALEIFDRIAHGDIYFFEFTVPEGANMFDIARQLEAQNILPAADFLAAAKDPQLIVDLAPKAKSLEGYLFPSTYRLTKHVTAEQLVHQMTTEFRKQWKKVSETVNPGDVRTMVTLASLVEKETGVASERPLIASVFANRLTKGMKLECDPTTIYAALLEDRYTGIIHRSDLESKNPYNTYQNVGLPPGPIANPGAASLSAALSPAPTNYLFFVATPQGGSHNFSESIAQHEKAVINYRRAAHRTALKALAAKNNVEGKKR
ncbi:MAG: endolytic transglycosylase MltG [Bryobacteraceae bacterium]